MILLEEDNSVYLSLPSVQRSRARYGPVLHGRGLVHASFCFRRTQLEWILLDQTAVLRAFICGLSRPLMCHEKRRVSFSFSVREQGDADCLSPPSVVRS